MAALSENKSSNGPSLLVCDMQRAFQNSIHNFKAVETSICHTIDFCKLLDVPIVVTTQNVSKLGATVDNIQSRLPKDVPTFDKTLFSMITPKVREQLAAQGSKAVVIVGIEAHICVTQSALDLLAAGYSVTILADAVSSSSSQERKLALRRLQAAGVTVTTLESWIFTVVKDSSHPAFRDVSKFLKSTMDSRGQSIKALL